MELSPDLTACCWGCSKPRQDGRVGGSCGGCGHRVGPGLFQLHSVPIPRLCSGTSVLSPRLDSPGPHTHMPRPHPCPFFTCRTSVHLTLACRSQEAGGPSSGGQSTHRGQGLFCSPFLLPAPSHLLWLTSLYPAHRFFSFHHFGQNK